MPYTSPPDRYAKNLTPKGRRIWTASFNSSFNKDRDEEKSFRIANAAVTKAGERMKLGETYRPGKARSRYQTHASNFTKRRNDRLKAKKHAEKRKQVKDEMGYREEDDKFDGSQFRGMVNDILGEAVPIPGGYGRLRQQGDSRKVAAAKSAGSVVSAGWWSARSGKEKAEMRKKRKARKAK